MSTMRLAQQIFAFTLEGPMVSQSTPVALEAPTQDERTLAFLAHLLQAFTGFFAPLILGSGGERTAAG